MVIWPCASSPATNGPCSFTPNHSPNSRWSVSARHARDSGALSSMRFSIRAFILATSELHVSAAHRDTQPRGCVMRSRLRQQRPGLAPIRAFVVHLVEYACIPHPWDDRAVGGGVNT